MTDFRTAQSQLEKWTPEIAGTYFITICLVPPDALFPKEAVLHSLETFIDKLTDLDQTLIFRGGYKNLVMRPRWRFHDETKSKISTLFSCVECPVSRSV